MKDYLVNNNLYIENIMDYENQNLRYLYVSDAVGIATKYENHQRIYTVYLTDEFGGIEFTKDYQDFQEALIYAKDLYKGLRDYNFEMGAGVYFDSDINYSKEYARH